MSREQLAKDNGMTIEFVNWFFENKKDGCGNVWFMMMAAMWEGYQAATASIQAERDQLAAECAALKKAVPPLKMINADNDSWDDVSIAEDIGFNAAISTILRNLPQTPATDRFLAEQRAQGVDAAIEAAKQEVANEFQRETFEQCLTAAVKYPQSNLAGKVEMAAWLELFAAQLRNEVKV